MKYLSTIAVGLLAFFIYTLLVFKIGQSDATLTCISNNAKAITEAHKDVAAPLAKVLEHKDTIQAKERVITRYIVKYNESNCTTRESLSEFYNHVLNEVK